MSYRVLEGESVEAAVRRIAREQIGKAAEDIECAGEDLHEAVHEFRKRCKKIRGLIRMVRPALPAYAEENAWFRDRAGALSSLRDATSMQECLADLIERYADELDDDAFVDVRRWLAERRDEMASEQDGITRLAAIREELPAAARRVSAWRLESPGIDAIEAGIRKTYARARKAMQRAAEEPGSGNFHEWRKRVKYYRYQTRIVSPAWPRVLAAVHKEARHLSDLLGDDHDLAVLRETLAEAVCAAGEPVAHAALFALIDHRSEELRTESFGVGRRLFVEKPKRHGARLRGVLEAWRDEQNRSPG